MLVAEFSRIQPTSSFHGVVVISELCHRNLLFAKQLKYQQLQVSDYFYNQLK